MRRTVLIATMVALAVMVVGCATAPPFDGYKNGPVTLYIGEVRHICAAGALSNRGCMIRYPNGRIEVYCARGDYECIAHELRHVADPGWQHDLDSVSLSSR